MSLGFRERKRPMLVLSRMQNESIMIGDDIVVMVVDIRGGKVRLGIKAPREVPVHREEIFNAIKRQEEENSESQT